MTSLGNAILSVTLQAGNFTAGLQTVRRNARTALTQLEQDAQRSANRVGSAFSDGMRHSSNMIQDLAHSAGAALGTITNPAVVATAAITGLGIAAAASVDKAATFEQQMSAVGAVADATGAQLEEMSDLALQMGAKTSFSAQQAAIGMEELAKAGVSTSNIIGGGLEGALSLAAASGMKDLGKAAEIASNALNTFSLNGKDMGMVADVIASTANSSALGVEDWAQSLSAAGPVVAQAGIKVNEFSAIMGIMANNALKGSDAGTSLKTMLMMLQSPSDQAAKSMKALGLAVYDSNGKMLPFTTTVKGAPSIMKNLEQAFKGLSEEQRNQAATSIFGADGIRAFNILMKEGSQKVADMTTAVSKQGTAAETAEKRLNNFRGATEQMTGAIETLAINFGTIFLPTLTAIVKEFTVWINILNSAVSWVRKLGDEIRQLVKPYVDAIKQNELLRSVIDAVKVAVAVLAGGTGLVMLRTGLMALVTAIRAAVAPAITALIAALGPVIVPIAAIAAATGALYLAWRTNFLGIRDLTSKVVDNVKLFLARFPTYFKAIQETLKILGGVFKDVFEGISKIVRGVSVIFYELVLVPLAKMGQEIGKRLIAIGETFASWVNSMYETFKPMLDFFRSVGVKVGDFVMGLAGKALDALKGKAKEAGAAVGDMMDTAADKDKSGKVRGALNDIAEGYDQIKGAGDGAGESISAAWKKAVTEANKITPATIKAQEAQKKAQQQAQMAAEAAAAAAKAAQQATTRTVDLGKATGDAAKISTEAIKKLIPQAEVLVSALNAAEKAGNFQGIKNATLSIDAFKRANKGGAEAISLVSGAMDKANQVAQQNADATSNLSKAMRDMQREWVGEINNRTLTIEKAQDYAYALIDIREAMMKLPSAQQQQLRAQYDQLMALNKSSAATVKAIESYNLMKKSIEPLREKLQDLAEDWKRDINAKTLSAKQNETYQDRLKKLYEQINKLPAAARAMLKADIDLMNQINKAGVATSNAVEIQKAYENSLVNLAKAVKNYSREELEAAKSRVIANGGDQKKLKIIQDRLNELNAARTEATVFSAKENVDTLKDEVDGLESEYARRGSVIKDNLAAQYLLELTLGQTIMAKRKEIREAERKAELAETEQKYNVLIDKNKGNSAEQVRLREELGRRLLAINKKADEDIAALETAHTDKLLQLSADRETALKSLSSDARQEIRKQTIAQYESAIQDAESSRDRLLQIEDQKLADEQITTVQAAKNKLKIMQDFEGVLRRKQLDMFDERKRLETEAEEERYNDLVADLKKRGLYTSQVEEEQKRLHLGKMAKIETDYNTDRNNALIKLDDDLMKARGEVARAEVKAAEEKAKAIAEASQDITATQLEELSKMNGMSRQAARDSLQNWVKTTTGVDDFTKALLELERIAPQAAKNIKAALNKITGADGDAGKDFTKLADNFKIDGFKSTLNNIGVPTERQEAYDKAYTPYSNLEEKVKEERQKLVDAYAMLDAEGQKAQKGTYDALLKSADAFIQEILTKGTQAATKAAEAFVQAQKDAEESARLQLDKASFDVGVMTQKQMQESLAQNTAYWQKRVDDMVKANVTGTELVNAQIELQKAKRNELNFVIDQQTKKLQDLKNASTGAENAFNVKLISKDEYMAALQADLDYNKGLINNTNTSSEARVAALQRVYEIEKKIKELNMSSQMSFLQKATDVLGYAQQAVGAFSNLAGAMGDDKLAANLTGLGNAFNFLKDTATDVMKLMANPADIGTWVRLGVRIVTTIADAINGFKKAKAEAKKLQDDFNAQFDFIDGNKLASFTTRSRGFLADVFGGGPEVVKVINEAAAKFAKTLESGVKSALTNSVRAFLTVSDEELKKLNMTAQQYAIQSLREGIKEAILNAVVEAIIQSAVIKGALGQLLTDLSTALASGDMNLASSIIRNIGQAIPGIINGLTPVMNQLRDTINSVFPSTTTVDATVNPGVDGLSIPAQVDMPASVQVIAQTQLTDKFDSLGAIIERQIAALDKLTKSLDTVAETGFKHSFQISEQPKQSVFNQVVSALRYNN